MLEGSIINALAIIAATLVGLAVHKALSERITESIQNGLGLVLLVLGIESALKLENIMVVVVSLVVGAIIGEALRIEDWLERTGRRLETRIGSDSGQFGKAFITSSVLYCTGPMAIMGALENGLSGTYDILLIKSLLDGTISVVFSASMGIGVMFSAFPVFIYQGGLSLLAGLLKPFLTTPMVNNLTSLGGILILGLGLNMLQLTKIRVANLLPGIILLPVVMALALLVS